MQRFAPAGLVPVGFQTMTLSNTTAVAVNSTCRAGNYLVISVETTDARMRADGVAPTNTTGVLLTKALSPLILDGYNRTPNLKFCRAGGSSSSIVSLMAFRRGPA